MDMFLWKNALQTLRTALLKVYQEDKSVYVLPIAFALTKDRKISHNLILQLEVDGFLICKSEHDLEKANYYIQLNPQ